MHVNKRIFLEAAGLGLIKFFRKLFLHTPLSRLRITGYIREKIYKIVVKSENITISYMGVELKAPSHDLGIVPGLIGGYYEKAELTVYKALLRKASMIVDVGGNIGLYTVIGARYMNPMGRIVTFEPVPSNVDHLKINISLNSVEKKVTVEPLAIGENDGMIDLFISEKSLGNHSASSDNAGKNSKKISINKTSIDNYYRKNNIENLDILKIDIEGYDYFALKGALKTINKYKPTLFIEFIPDLVRNCGINPEDFGSILFKLYDHCFVVDELKNTLQEVPQIKKESFMKKISNTNLVLVSNIEHISVLKKFIV